MQAEEIRFLFEYDRWATGQVLAALDGLDSAVWTRPNAIGDRCLGDILIPIGDRCLGDILIHQLGAAQRWRIGFQTQGSGESPEPENEPLPTIQQLAERWEAEWAVTAAWLPSVTDDFVAYVFDGVPVWQMLVHVMNHGTQHRAEAALVLTNEGRSPGELDLINYAEAQSAANMSG